MKGADPRREPYIGGQAVIEGVMMRSPGFYTVAVRLPQGSVEVKHDQVASLAAHRLLKLPVLRGAGSLAQMLYLGIKALYYSADKAVEDTEAEKKKPKKGFTSSITIAVSLCLSFVLGIALFIWFPLILTGIILDPPGSFKELLSIMHRPQMESTLLFNLIDGVIRVLVLIGYIAVLSLWGGEFRRIFQYHGAEHKTINAYENNEPITVDSARKHSTLHPRCGTSFLFVVMVVSILAFSTIRSDLFIVRFGSRIVLLPLIAGIGYEVIKFCARNRKSFWCRLIIGPGLLLQRLSTREPTDDMLEVAIDALKAALHLEEEAKNSATEQPISAETG